MVVAISYFTLVSPLCKVDKSCAIFVAGPTKVHISRVSCLARAGVANVSQCQLIYSVITTLISLILGLEASPC